MNPFAEMYNRPETVAEYLRTYLEASEVQLLNEVSQRPGEWEMLDIGVGAGRTAFFFAPFVKGYTGIDLASRMVEACRERFRGLEDADKVRFRVGNAVALEGFADSSLDLVLFSLNGIDCIDPAERDQCLLAIRRVLRNGGSLMFSAHNLLIIDFYFQDGAHPQIPDSALDPKRRARIREENGPLADNQLQDQVLFWDGVYGDEGILRHVFIKPRFQVRELERLGFSDVRALSTETGKVLEDAELEAVRDPSIAYWCEASK
jgi:ubiquinone/menaquinone biosynthesis C-methylase UbiE